MKKIGKLFAVLSIVASVMMMCGCGFIAQINETYDKWYKYEKSVDIPLGDDSSSDSATAATLSGAEFYLCYNKKSGLLVVVQKDSVQTVSVAQGLLEQDITITTGAQKQYTKDQFSTRKWAVLVASGKIKACDQPKFVAHHDQCIDVSTALGNGIQWKKVLRNILINQWLGE